MPPDMSHWCSGVNQERTLEANFLPIPLAKLWFVLWSTFRACEQEDFQMKQVQGVLWGRLALLWDQTPWNTQETEAESSAIAFPRHCYVLQPCLPPSHQQDHVSQHLVADHLHKYLHKRHNTHCVFFRILYQVSLPNEQQTDSVFGGQVLDYCLFDTHLHMHTISLQLWQCSWSTAPLKHPLQPGIWLHLRYKLTLRKIFFPLSIIKYNERVCLKESSFRCVA